MSNWSKKCCVEKQEWREINDILKMNGFSWLSNGKNICWIKVSWWRILVLCLIICEYLPIIFPSLLIKPISSKSRFVIPRIRAVVVTNFFNKFSNLIFSCNPKWRTPISFNRTQRHKDYKLIFWLVTTVFCTVCLHIKSVSHIWMRSKHVNITDLFSSTDLD